MRLFVGNLPWSVGAEELKNIFSAFPVEDATVITNKFSGRSKGFGFVEIADEAAAKKAIAELNNKEVEGRQITVNEAKPADPDAPRRQPPRRFNNNRRNFNREDRR